MDRATLPAGALPAWSFLNNVKFLDTKVADIPEKGFGLVCQKDLLITEDAVDTKVLVAVPHNLILNAEAVEEYAKEDGNFRQLLEVSGHKSTRGDILLFLLVQTLSSSRRSQGLGGTGVYDPWTQYVKFLPQTVPVPTTWTERERQLLCGTSLESAVNGKLSALNAEFNALRDTSSDIPYWNDMLWLSGDVTLEDWILFDAQYRSRCLELPRSGEALVPCIDMVNHATWPNAYYEENSQGEAVLLLRPPIRLTEGDELTISYGEKSAAEMLFSYGFIDDASDVRRILLPLTGLDDDPLAKAKVLAFGGAPKIEITQGEDGAEWKCPFAYLMCLNEEDGLEFRLLQDREGGRQLRLLWQGDDVTDRAADFETLVQGHTLRAVFKLRVVTVIQEYLQTQVERMHSPPVDSNASLTEMFPTWKNCVEASSLLKATEMRILDAVIEALEVEKAELMGDETVIAYLNFEGIAEDETGGGEDVSEDGDDDVVRNGVSNDDDDFS